MADEKNVTRMVAVSEEVIQNLVEAAITEVAIWMQSVQLGGNAAVRKTLAVGLLCAAADRLSSGAGSVSPEAARLMEILCQRANPAAVVKQAGLH